MCAFALIVVAAIASTGESLDTRTVAITVTCSVVKIPVDAETVDLWMPVPSDTDGQTVLNVTVLKPTDGAIATEPRYGNRIYHKRFTAPFPETDEGLQAEIVCEIGRTEIKVIEAKTSATVSTAPPPDNMRVYLEPNRLIPVDGPPEALVADLEFAGKAPIEAARMIYDFLLEEMTYNWMAPGAGKGDVLWACDSKKGDCTDYHSLFLALCRGQGIPADHEFGYPIRGKRSSGVIPHYHCWARFWVKDVGWIPVDVSEADKHDELREYNFGSQSASLFKYSHGRDVVLEPPQQGAPLNVFIDPYVEVDGVPHNDVKHRVSFKDILP